MIDFQTDDTQDLVAGIARDFASRVLAPRAAELDESSEYPRAALREAASLGLLGVNVPEELGGSEAGAVAYSLAMTELGAACAATTVAICVSNMVAEVICKFGTPAQRETWVPRLCSGDCGVGGFALSEAGAGSDPGAMATRATRVDGGYRIDGSKLWITSGNEAGVFVVWARTAGADSGTRGITAFLVPGDAPGLRAGKPESKMGQRASPTTALEFDGVFVDDAAVLGQVDRGFTIAMMALDGGRIGIASLALGLARAAQGVALEHAVQRVQFGRPIAEFQAIQWMLADNATVIEAARALVLRAAWRKQRGLEFSREAAMAKLYASEQGFACCNRALQILGGSGYTREFPVERFLRDIRVTSIYEGTSEIQRVVIGRAVAKGERTQGV